jgi:hypothetical protein
MSQPLLNPPPGFDDLPTDAKVDYVNALWERVFNQDNPKSPDWHRDLVRAELAGQESDPDATEDWETVRANIVRRLHPGSP